MHFNLNTAVSSLLFSVKPLFVFMTGLYPLTAKEQYIPKVLCLLHTGNRQKQQAEYTAVENYCTEERVHTRALLSSQQWVSLWMRKDAKCALAL